MDCHWNVEARESEAKEDEMTKMESEGKGYCKIKNKYCEHADYVLDGTIKHYGANYQLGFGCCGGEYCDIITPKKEMTSEQLFDKYQQAIVEKRKCTTCSGLISAYVLNINEIIEFNKTGQCKRCQMVGGDSFSGNPILSNQEWIEMNEIPLEERRNTGSFVTDSKTNYVEENDRLEAEITIHINVKHKDYKKFISALDDLLYKGRNTSGLITYMSGI